MKQIGRLLFLLLLLAGVGRGYAEQVVFSKIMYEPEAGKPAYLELYNVTSNPFDIANWRLSGGVNFDFPAFSPTQRMASFLKPFERVVLSASDPGTTRKAYAIPDTTRVFGPWRGKLDPEGARLTLKDKNGITVCTVKFGADGLWPAIASGSGQALTLADPNAKVDDWHNWAVSLRLGGEPGFAPVRNAITAVANPETEASGGQILVDYSAVWRYNDRGRNVENGWQQPDFDDRAWRQGPGLLGFDPKPLPKPGLRTRVNFGGQITYYFRLAFTYQPGPKPVHQLVLDQILDDGAVYYLNGRELGRCRLPDGPVDPLTRAKPAVPTAGEETGIFLLDPAILKPGTNVLAVEVHQNTPNSSDVVFGMRLRLTSPIPPGLVINEVAPGQTGGFVEFFNKAAQPQNLKGCYLSDSTDNLRQHLITNDLLVPSGGLAVLSLSEYGISKVTPLTLFLTGPDGEQVLNALMANFGEDGRPLGRKPDGGPGWYRFAEATRGQPNPNTAARQGGLALRGEEINLARRGAGHAADAPVIINEIMYDPPYGAENTEYIELFNRSAQPVDLSGWQFSEGIEFTFPPGTKVAPGGYLVVAADAKRFQSVYGELPVLGDYKGRLKHSGELFRLLDAQGKVVDEVDFKAEGDWPLLAHGGGSSMELAHPALDNARSSAWRDSDESGKSAWTAFAMTNVYLELNPNGGALDTRKLFFYLPGDGHVALRKIGLWNGRVNEFTRANRLTTNGNSAFGWLVQGNHAASYMTNQELHLVSDGHGNNKADRAELKCMSLERSKTYVLRFEARWISGCPRLIAQSGDHSLGGSFLLPLPARLGTPGQPNSVSGASSEPKQAPPQLDELAHHPVVPHSTDMVKITARLAALAGVGTVTLWHRKDSPDNNVPWSSKLMYDDGVHAGDATAGDGIYSAELSEYRTNGAIVQFYVEAASANGQRLSLPRPCAAAPALYIVDDRKLRRDLRLDRIIISAYDLGSMSDGDTAKYAYRHPRLSNHRYNMTYIFNEEKVFYGGAIRIAGSPFTRGNDLSKAKWELPKDRPFRGRTKFFYDNDSTYNNQLCRYLLYQMGHVSSQSEWVWVIINNAIPYLKEDTEPVTGEFLERNFKNGNRGELYHIEDEWWFDDEWEKQNRDAEWRYKGTTDPTRYRSEWMKRTREVEDDFSTLIEFFKTISAGKYADAERFLDIDAILRYTAVRGYINDWDNFTGFRGKNAYFYRHPDGGKFQFLQWDSDLAFRDANYPLYGPRVAALVNQPANLKRFQQHVEALIAFSQSPQMQTWFELQQEAIRPRPPNVQFYNTFFTRRNNFARSSLGRNAPAPRSTSIFDNLRNLFP